MTIKHAVFTAKGGGNWLVIQLQNRNSVINSTGTGMSRYLSNSACTW